MLSLAAGLKIYVYTPATDMRKGINGLCGIVRSELGTDPTNGSLYLFINRRRDRLKILHFDGGGFWLYYRLLEAGTFEELSADGDSRHLQMDATQLSMLLSGVSLKAWQRRRKRYSHHPCEHQPEQAA
jgi:transposase